MSTVFGEQPDLGNLDLEDRHALRRVAGLSTELQDISEVEYRALRLERVVLIGVWAEGSLASAENSLRELSRLAETAGSEVLEGLIQRRSRVDAATYVGSGKARELAGVVAAAGADTVICDGELSPSQLRKLESVVQVKVIDRTALILDIFAQHARSREGKAQVELASCSTCCPGSAAGASRCPGRPAAGWPAAAGSAPAARARPSWKPTGGGCGRGSPACRRTSTRCRPAGRSSAAGGAAVTCRPW